MLIKYIVPHFTSDTTWMNHAWWYIEAIDTKSNQRIWLKEIYNSTIDTNIEADKQVVFIKSIKLKNNFSYM